MITAANVKETRFVSLNCVRGLCIKKEWYTGGTCEEYSKMFDMVTQLNHTPLGEGWTNLLLKIAQDIYQHSDIDLSESGCDEDEMILSIAYLLSNECCQISYEMRE